MLNSTLKPEKSLGSHLSEKNLNSSVAGKRKHERQDEGDAEGLRHPRGEAN
jgi:hypothetical protein